MSFPPLSASLLMSLGTIKTLLVESVIMVVFVITSYSIHYTKLYEAVAAIALLTVVVAGGMRRSNRSNAVIVSLTLIALAAFVIAGARSAAEGAGRNLSQFLASETDGVRGLLHATALVFVAYTGYGRIRNNFV